MIKFVKAIQVLQHNLLNKLHVRFYKVDVLINYWDKLFGQITYRAQYLDDDKMQQIAFGIAQVPKEVRYEVLKAYVNKCREIYHIGFF